MEIIEKHRRSLKNYENHGKSSKTVEKTLEIIEIVRI